MLFTMQRTLCLIDIFSLPVVFLPRYHAMNNSFLLLTDDEQDSFLTEEDLQLATLVGIQRFCIIKKGFFKATERILCSYGVLSTFSRAGMVTL